MTDRRVVSTLLAGCLLCLAALPAAAQDAKPAAAPATQPAGQAQAAPPDLAALLQHDKGAVVAKLSNGLTVIVKPFRSSPVVSVRAYVRAGGMLEREWLGCGLSHLLEHLVAKGEVDDGAGGHKSSRPTIASIGGQSNAYTSMDVTCYYISAAASKTSQCIDLIADWMARCELAQKDFEREHGVVQRELEMGKDDPDRQIWYAHAQNVYGGHPACVPVIGYEEPLRKVTLEDVKAYHARMYAPQNMVFVVVGDIDPQAVLEQVRKAFQGFEQSRAVDLSLPPVRPFTGVRKMIHPHPALQESIQQMSFQTIPLIHEDLYALDVLDELLTGGGSSRLVEKIQREKKLVTSINSTSWTPAWGTGSFTIMFRAQADKAEAAEQAILDELRQIIDRGIQEDELGRAKRRKTAAYVHSQQEAEDVASTLASDYLSTGDVDFSRSYTERVQAVTADQVRQAARKYFTFNKMAITRLVPASKFEAGAVSAQKTQAGETTAFKLPNGLRVVLAPNPAVGLASMALVTKGGLMTETAQTNGLGSLMTRLATKGAAGRTATQIASFFDEAGGSIGAVCGNNSFYWQATVLDDRFDQALDVFADVVLKPAFDDKELDILRPILIDAVKQVDEEWNTQSRKFFFGQFFQGSPYAMLPTGSIEVLSKATAQQVRDHYKKSIHAESSCLSVFGNFDPAATRAKIEKLFADMPSGQCELPEVPARKVGAKDELHILPTKNKVAAVMVGSPGMKVQDIRDRVAIDVLDTIISGYQLPAGWLHEELRGKQLVYVVHAYNWPALAPGAFITYAACQPAQAGNVVDIICKNLRRAAKYTPTQAEIDLAVNTILTAELLDNQSVSKLALQAAVNEIYGLGHDLQRRLEAEYRKVTPADVAAVAQKYLSGSFVITVTTPQPELLKDKAPAADKQASR